MTLHIRNRTHRWLWVVVGLVALAVVCVAAVILLAHVAESPKQSNTSQESKELEPPYITELTSSSLFTGNIYWGRFINEWSRASNLKTAYPFSRLNEFKRESYQNWISGLECPLVEGLHLTSKQENETLSFNCSPDYLPEASKWFNIVTLANNHTDNQGADGFKETQKHLDENDIQYFGHYDPRALNDICEVISINVVATYSDMTTKPARFPVAMCGYHGVFRIPSEDALEVMEQYSKVMPVIAMPHAGAEYQAEPDALKTKLYRSMIDHGADMVIGDHPHWVQTTEAYKGKLIVYSMGNFIFDQQFNREVMRAAVIRVDLSVSATGTGQLERWIEIAEGCMAYHDKCLKEITEQELAPLDFSYKYDAIGSSTKGRLAHPASESDEQDILTRLRWKQTMSGLALPHAKL